MKKLTKEDYLKKLNITTVDENSVLSMFDLDNENDLKLLTEDNKYKLYIKLSNKDFYFGTTQAPYEFHKIEKTNFELFLNEKWELDKERIIEETIKRQTFRWLNTVKKEDIVVLWRSLMNQILEDPIFCSRQLKLTDSEKYKWRKELFLKLDGKLLKLADIPKTQTDTANKLLANHQTDDINLKQIILRDYISNLDKKSPGSFYTIFEHFVFNDGMWDEEMKSFILYTLKATIAEMHYAKIEIQDANFRSKTFLKKIIEEKTKKEKNLEDKKEEKNESQKYTKKTTKKKVKETK